MNALLSAGLALSVVIVAYQFRLLTLGGATIAFVLGWLIFGLGGWQFSLPIVVFFGLSSLLSRVGRQKKAHLSPPAQKPDPRSASQVMANGFIPSLVLLCWSLVGKPALVYAYLAAIAAANADTWATEIGMLAKGNPRSILTLRPVTTGESGGVSHLGTAAALLGALTIAATGFALWQRLPGRPFSLQDLLVVTAAGLMAQAVDSLLGATVQAKYLCQACGRTAESPSHCPGAEVSLRSGLPVINNDWVNLLANAFAAFSAWSWFEMFGRKV